MSNGNDLYNNWNLESYNKAYNTPNNDVRFLGESDIYKNMDENMNYRPPGSFLPSGIGSFYNPPPPVYPGADRNIHEGFGTADVSSTFPSPEKKGMFSRFTTPILSLLKKGLPQMTPEKKAEVAAIQGSADQYGWGNLPGTGLQGNIWPGQGGNKVYVRAPDGTMIVRDKNLQSGFGSKTIGEMVQKKENWMQGQFEKYGDEWTDDEHKGLSSKLYNYAKKKGLIDQWKTGNVPVDSTVTETITTGTDQVPKGPITINPSHFAEQGGGGYQQAPINKPDPSFSAPSTTGHMGPGGVHYAQGGRAGYRFGKGPVLDENIDESTLEFMQDQGVPYSEMAEGAEGTNSAFELRVQELVDTGMSWGQAWSIAAEEFGLKAEGPEESFSEEGIASIV